MINLISPFVHTFNFKLTDILVNRLGMFIILNQIFYPGNVGVGFDTICCHGNKIRSRV